MPSAEINLGGAGTRIERLEQALFRGRILTLENTTYRQTVETLGLALLEADFAGGDLTVGALGISSSRATAAILAEESGIAAGLGELDLLLRGFGIRTHARTSDGGSFGRGDTLLELEGSEAKLLALERVSLNILQRMCGVASRSRALEERVRETGSRTRVVGTRKTPWGLLDKRALHLGGCGTHRLNLGDAILIKNNHLALLGVREEEVVPLAIQKVWNYRRRSAFVEVEVRTLEAARQAAETFCRLQERDGEAYPCLVMLDNTNPSEAGAVIDRLRREGLWDSTLVEASGRISESNVRAYAASGVDAISIGALTHSSRALDLRQRMS
jgi:nicotinate-nucleotide pyrophosphorylase (carboxylating)